MESGMGTELTGQIFDIKKYALHDGPGIRTTVFLKGCPLSCQWCHNPEGHGDAPRVVYDLQRCIGCRDCMNACPQNAISATPDGMSTDRQNCIGCGVCTDACPAGARRISERTVTVGQILETIKADVLFYDQSGGGVTFSGGEPLLQAEFLVDVLRACGRYDIHRAVDTSGQAQRSDLQTVARHTDLFLYDVKLMDSKRHQQFTGVPNQTILDNLAYLHHSGAHIIIRFPLIPDVNDDRENLDQLCRFLNTLEGLREIHILPYHAYQKNKYSRFGMAYAADPIFVPTAERVSKALEKFEKNGFQVSLGG